MLEAGQQVDRYVVESLLGAGGMAEVYRVRHETLHSLHALKVLTLQHPSIRERLIQEGRVQAGLSHPGVLTVTDVIDVDGMPGLILEFVDGPDLLAWVGDANPPRDQRLEVMVKVLDAVGSAHAKGWVHRDLKPANVLLHIDRLQPKVADFGLVKALMGENGGGSATRTGLPMGTPAYMSPEQINDAKNVGPEADVFSLGCMLHFLLSGQDAFQGQTTLELFDQIARGTRAPLPDDVPAALSAVIDKAVKPDPTQRYPDANAMKVALEQALAAGPVTLAPAAAPSLSGDAEPTLSRRASVGLAAGVGGIALLGAGAAVLLVVLGLGLWMWSSREAPELVLDEGVEEKLPNKVDEDPEALSVCSISGSAKRLGYARARLPFLTPKGRTWQVLDEVPVYFDPTSGGDPECMLPKGARVELVERAAKSRGSAWVAVYGDKVTLPDSE